MMLTKALVALLLPMKKPSFVEAVPVPVFVRNTS